METYKFIALNVAAVVFVVIAAKVVFGSGSSTPAPRRRKDDDDDDADPMEGCPFKPQAAPEHLKKEAKQADSKKKKESPSKDEASAGTKQIWTVTVHKSNEGRYGMVWKNTRQEGRCLKITDLKPQGAIAKLNKSLPAKTQIKPGDFIRAVNHKRGYEEMRNELGSESLTLELERVSKQ